MYPINKAYNDSTIKELIERLKLTDQFLTDDHEVINDEYIFL